MENKFPWVASYPKGVRAEVNVDRYQSLAELFEEGFSKYASRTAYTNMGKSFTYSEVDRLSQDFASYLTNVAGLKKGDRLAIQMPNLLQYPVVMIGALRAGVTVVNTNPLYTPREMEHQFTDAGVTAIVILANFASNLEKVLPNTQIKTVIVTEIGDLLGGLKGGIVSFVVKHIKKMVPAYNLPKAISFKTALAQGAQHKFVKPQIQPQNLAFLQYTGGTTGVAKGAMLTHRNIVAHTMICHEWFTVILSGTDTMITAIPLYHIFALTVNGILMFYVGAQNILVTNPRDMKAFIGDLKKYPFTLMTGVNTLFNGLLNQEAFKAVDFSHLKMAIGGGMAVQTAVANKWEALTGKPLVEGYGLSETSPVLCCNPLDGSHQQGFIGLPFPNTEVGIFDDAGNPVAQGERGEICARGPQVMPGYWNKQDESDKVFLNKEWFKTGDIGIMSPDGFFKIVDRKKDMVLVSGFNVYPNEVEDAIALHPKVLEVAAIGVPDDKSTEAVKIFVVKKDPSLTEDELHAHAEQNLTNYKRPKYIEFRTELPKSNIGKIIRRVLKEEEDKKAGK